MKKFNPAIILILPALSALLLAGCAGNDASSAKESEAPAASEAAAEPEAEPAPEITETPETPAPTEVPAAPETPAPTEVPAAPETPAQTETQKPAESDSVKLTADDAKKIAFDYAGVKETDVVLKKAALTTDDGITEYEVEFYYKFYTEGNVFQKFKSNSHKRKCNNSIHPGSDHAFFSDGDPAGQILDAFFQKSGREKHFDLGQARSADRQVPS